MIAAMMRGETKARAPADGCAVHPGLRVVLGPPPDPRNYAWRDSGLRVGIWRILRRGTESGDFSLCPGANPRHSTQTHHRSVLPLAPVSFRSRVMMLCGV